MKEKNIKIKHICRSKDGECCKPVLEIHGKNIDRVQLACLKAALEKYGFIVSFCNIQRGLHDHR